MDGLSQPPHFPTDYRVDEMVDMDDCIVLFTQLDHSCRLGPTVGDVEFRYDGLLRFRDYWRG